MKGNKTKEVMMNKHTHLALWAFIGITCCVIGCGNNEAKGIDESNLAASDLFDQAQALKKDQQCRGIKKGGNEESIDFLVKCSEEIGCKAYASNTICRVKCNILKDQKTCETFTGIGDLSQIKQCKWVQTSCIKKSYKFFKVKTTCDEWR
ncbi:MAG: hypothetical protein AAF310_02540, partial [Myxococcota bacterium]